MTTPELTDRRKLALQRERARRAGPALFLHELVADEVQERLSDVNKQFSRPAIVTAFPEIWRDRFPEAVFVADEDVLKIDPHAHDLILHVLCLHWANDPVGQLVQCRRGLKPDGLCISICFGDQTLNELRACLAEAEVAVSGGLSPRVAPMGELRDLGALLQRAGFALPVADTLSQTAAYRDSMHLMHDLRAMGETNALSARQKTPPRPELFAQAQTIYAANFSDDAERVNATFDLVFLTGWAPDESQQKPLTPGSATTRLADALGSAELPLERE